MPRIKLFDETAVLEKAMHVFWRNGYNATSIQDLVDALGINRASLYSTFGDKMELFRKAYTLYQNANLERIEEMMSGQSNVPEGFRKLLYAAIDEALKNSETKGCLMVNTATEMLPMDSEMQVILDATRTAIEDIFSRHLKRGVAEGQISGQLNIDHVATYLFAVYSGLNVVAKIHADRNHLEGMADTAINVLVPPANTTPLLRNRQS